MSMEQVRAAHPAPVVRPTLVQRAVNYLARTTVATQTRMTRPVSYTSNSTSYLKLSSSERRWSASAIAYRCITAISSNASSLDLDVHRESGEIIEGHWLSRLWAAPNPLLSGRTFGEYLWQRLETRGETFVYLDRGDTGSLAEPLGMWPIFGDVTVVVDKNLAGEIVGYVVDVGGRRVPLLPSEVLWLRYPDAESEWGCLSPLAAAAHAVGLDAHARAWQMGELKNGARPTAVVYLGDLEEEQHQEVVDSYRSRIEGAHNAGRTLFVSSAVQAKVERLSLTPEEISWLDTRRTSWEEISVAFGVPKDYLLGGATYENRDAARSTLWSDTIIGKLEVVAGEVARQLLNPGERARFNTDDVAALQENEKAKSERTNAAVERDVMTLDEARALIGLDPLPGGVGELTLTAYRMLLQLEAQAMLLQVDPDARQMPALQLGALSKAKRTTPLALPVARVTRVGLTFDEAQHEYDVHEKIGVRAVKRLAGKQEAIVLANLHKLFGRSGSWAAKRTELLQVLDSRRQVEAGEMTDPDGLVPLALRAAVDDLLDAERAATMTREQIESFMAGVWMRGGETTAKQLGIGFDVFEPLVLDRMDARLDELAGMVTETTRTVLEEKVLLEGVAAGESVDQLAARVRAIFVDLSSWRAQMIARTETVGGMNGASYITAEESGVVTARVWLATGDTRTRDSHVAVNEERVVTFGQRYSNGCLHPGNGPAAEVIMCRCTEMYEVE